MLGSDFDDLHRFTQARRNCNFNNPNPATQCADGGCNGGLVCDRNSGTGVPPATLAEFTLSGDGNRDFYDGEYTSSTTSRRRWHLGSEL